MAVKKILLFPDAANILQAKSEQVSMSDPKLGVVLQDMYDTLMATSNGVGLAAPQIGYLKRIFMLRKDFIVNDLEQGSYCANVDDAIITFINPKIVAQKGMLHEEEGCLSVPNTYIPIQRFRAIKVKALNEKGEKFIERVVGLASRAVQQEIDHLNGVLIIDHQK